VLVDDRLNVKYANGAAAIFLRAKRESLPGTSIQDHVKDSEVLESLRAVAGGGVRRRAIVEVSRPESQGGGVLRISVRPVRKDDSAAALLTIEDITQQRVADEARNAFVAQATHELRTPLTNIRLYVEQAIEAGDDNAVRTRALDVINQESRRLERIVGDMLSVSEIEAGSFKLRAGDVRLETMFDDLKAEYAAQAKEKNLNLSLHLPPKLPVLRGDRDKIVLALHNLIGNALKYTPEGGKVDVKVDADEQRLQVEVADTGIGISPEETDLIFEKFYRAKDKRVSAITGTGLGLALAREVVRMHGGDIAVRSQLDQGSTFTLTLPIRAEAA
jgi:signal transduction histidine kinase